MLIDSNLFLELTVISGTERLKIVRKLENSETINCKSDQRLNKTSISTKLRKQLINKLNLHTGSI